MCVFFCLVGVCAFVYLSVLYSEQYSLPEAGASMALPHDDAVASDDGWC